MVSNGGRRSRSRSPRGTEPPTESVRGLIGNRPIVITHPFISDDGRAAAQTFKAKPGDVFIATFPKSGTTWVQQICHQLRTGGHTDFDEISEEGIVQWLEVSTSLGMDLGAPQKAPRCYKTHQRLSALSHLETDGARYLCVVRDPTAALLSYFKFQLTKGHPSTASGDVNTYVKSSYITRGGEGEMLPGYGGYVWEFLVEFWKCHKLPNVKVIAYEHMLKDFGAQLDQIAEFLGLARPTGELRETVLEFTSAKWMSSHDHLFDDHFIAQRLKAAGSSFKFKVAQKVGLKVADGDGVITTLNAESHEIIARMWQEIVTPATGHASYADMIADL